MKVFAIAALFLFVACYGAEESEYPEIEQAPKIAPSAETPAPTSGYDLLIRPFTDDMSSNVGAVTPFVSIRFDIASGSALAGTSRGELASLIASQFELRNLGDGTLVDVARTFSATDEEGYRYRLEFAPTIALLPSQWYELRLEPTEPDLVDLVQSAVGVSESGVYSLRFTPGPAAVVRRVTITPTAASVEFSEVLYSSDGKVQIHVTQPDNHAANCTSSVPKNHWIEQGSPHLDASCENLDPSLPLVIEIEGDLHAADGSGLSTAEGPLQLVYQPDDWRPCVASDDRCFVHVPGR